MFNNEAIISESDKERVLYHIKKVNEILDKYSFQIYDNAFKPSDFNRAKIASKNAEAWISNLYTYEVK